MAFLAVNGVELLVENDSADEPKREIGEEEAAYDGTLRKSRQAVKRDISFTTPPMTAADAHAWDSFIRGLGHTWSFDDHLYSSKGLGPNSSTGLSVSAGGKFDDCMRIAGNNPAHTAAFAAELGSSWTVMVWRNTGGGWVHYAVNSDSQKWVDGVRNDAASTAWLSVSAGTVTITGDLVDGHNYDDLVAVPFVMPTGWPPVFGVASTAFSLLPRLTLTGDAINEAPSRTAMGTSESSRPIQAVVDGAFRNNARKLNVLFRQV